MRRILYIIGLAVFLSAGQVLAIDLDSNSDGYIDDALIPPTIMRDSEAQGTDLSNTPAAGSVQVNSSTGADTTLPAATTSNAGVMSAADKAKLDTVENNAAADQSAAEVPFTPEGSIQATNVQAAIQEVRDEAGGGGAGTDLSNTPAADSLQVNSSTGADTTLPAATTSNAGVMSATDKAKLDTVENNAAADQSAAEVPFMPDGSIQATDVQAAIQEVRDESAVDLTAPGPIGSATPSEGHFTFLEAPSFNFGTPQAGETGEVVLQEDPDNGTNVTGWKAPAALAADIVFNMPSSDGTQGQALVTDGNLQTSFATVLSPTDIGTTVQAWNANLDDLADGSLSGTAIGPGIQASNLTGTIDSARIGADIARLIDVTRAPVSVPSSATDTCTVNTWSKDDSYLYICVAQDTWRRVGISAW